MPLEGMFKKFICVFSAGALAFGLAPVFPAQGSEQSPEGTDLQEDSSFFDGAGYVQRNFTYHTLESDDEPTAEETASDATSDDSAADTAATQAQTTDATTADASETQKAGDAAELTSVTTDDADAAKQYYLDGWTGGGETGEASSGADIRRAWSLSKSSETAGGDTAVTVAQLDTGVDVDHEDLAENIDTEHMGTVVREEDGSYGVEAGVCEDIYGHGTHVAGILSAAANNGKGVAGVSYNAKLLPVNVCYLDSDGSCATDTQHLLAGFSYLKSLIDDGELTNLRVINISLGSDADQGSEEDYALEQAIKTFRDDYNVLTVCAGGNGDDEGEPITSRVFPSDFDETLSVSWLDADGHVAKSADYNEYKDISAPGTGIYSTMDPTKTLKNKDHEAYGTMSGSSMAAPVVSGIAALLWAKYPGLTTYEVKASLQETAKAIPDAPEELGSAGAVDAADALVYAGEHFAAADKTHITEAQVSSEDFSDSNDWYLSYTGEALTPSFTLSVGDTQLQEGTDYTVSYSDNVELGEATAVFTGTGDYQGVRIVHFDIVDDIAGCEIADIPSVSYTGSPIVPSLEVSDREGYQLQEGLDYVISACNNIAAGEATVTITGVHGYRGTLEAKFWIMEKSSKASTKTVTVNTKRVTDEALAAAVKSNTTTVALGSKVQGIEPEAFKKFPTVTKLVIKTTKLTKASVKDSLKGSKVKTITVSIGSKKTNRKYLKKYKEYFS